MSRYIYILPFYDCKCLSLSLSLSWIEKNTYIFFIRWYSSFIYITYIMHYFYLHIYKYYIYIYNNLFILYRLFFFIYKYGVSVRTYSLDCFIHKLSARSYNCRKIELTHVFFFQLSWINWVNFNKNISCIIKGWILFFFLKNLGV